MAMRIGGRMFAAVAAWAAALIAVRALHPVLEAGSYMLFLGAVVVVAATAGFRPAMLTTVLSILAIDFFFLAPRHSLALFAVTDIVLLILFGGMALLTSTMMGMLHRRQAKAERAALEAAGLASMMQRDAAELSHEVDALHVLRKERK